MNLGRMFEPSPNKMLHEVDCCRRQTRQGDGEVKKKKYKMQCHTRAPLQRTSGNTAATQRARRILLQVSGSNIIIDMRKKLAHGHPRDKLRSANTLTRGHASSCRMFENLRSAFFQEREAWKQITSRTIRRKYLTK
jgi:hypothetical protein